MRFPFWDTCALSQDGALPDRRVKCAKAVALRDRDAAVGGYGDRGGVTESEEQIEKNGGKKGKKEKEDLRGCKNSQGARQNMETPTGQGGRRCVVSSKGTSLLVISQTVSNMSRW